MSQIGTKVAEATNATKGVLALGVLLAVEGVEVFGIHDFSEIQEDWILRTVAFVGVLWIAATRRWSRLRL